MVTEFRLNFADDFLVDLSIEPLVPVNSPIHKLFSIQANNYYPKQSQMQHCQRHPELPIARKKDSRRQEMNIIYFNRIAYMILNGMIIQINTVHCSIGQES